MTKVDFEKRKNRKHIEKATNRGEFWKACPGTSHGYLCCGYQILTPSTGCGMYCTYCILQAYFDHQYQVHYTNTDDLEGELQQKMARWKGVVRFGTGEFGDSLYSEHITGASRMVASKLKKYPNAIVEFKTKSTNIGHLESVENRRQVIIGFSMNTPRMISLLEKNTASIQDRLQAAQKCIDLGFTVAFHFDPMFVYEGWEEEYRLTVESIFQTIRDYSKIAWCSMGGFRCMPSLKIKLKKTNNHLPLFAGEMIAASDGKLRYFRPLRVKLYSLMRQIFEKYDPSCTLYLCMESPEVWEESDMMKRIPYGLCDYLDRRAMAILDG